jgi:hypothetical protein
MAGCAAVPSTPCTSIGTPTNGTLYVGGSAFRWNPSSGSSVGHGVPPPDEPEEDEPADEYPEDEGKDCDEDCDDSLLGSHRT